MWSKYYQKISISRKTYNRLRLLQVYLDKTMPSEDKISLHDCIKWLLDNAPFKTTN